MHASFSLELKANLEVLAAWRVVERSRISEQPFSLPKEREAKVSEEGACK